MLFTRECDYAVRIMRALAAGEVVNVQQISASEAISVPITYKITRKLEQAGLLKSYRGINGGYALAVPLAQLSLYDVFSVIDERLLLSECSGGHCECARHSEEQPCKVRAELCRLQQLVMQELQAKKLAELL